MIDRSDADAYCSICGKHFEEDAAFCARCGTARASAGPDSAATRVEDVAPELERTVRRGSLSDLLEEEMSKEMSAPQPLQGEEHASVMGVTDQAPYAVGPARSTASFAVAGLLLSLGFVISFVSSLRHATIFFDTVKYQWGDGTGGKLHATFVVLGLVATPLVVASAAALLIPSLNRGLRALLSIVVIGVSGLLAVADIHMLVDPHNQYLRWFTDLRALMVWSDIVGREFEGLGDQGLTVNVWIALTLNVGLIGVMSIGWYRSARTRVRW